MCDDGASTERMTAATHPRAPFVRELLPVWLVLTVWDGICATALGVLAYGSPAAGVWKGVASTVLGASAVDGGAGATAVGLGLHAMVALTWSAVFVAATRIWPALRRIIRTPGGALAVAAVYGPLIWLTMSLIVIPLATGRPPRGGPRWWVQVGAHIPFVSLPLVFTARRVMTRV